VAIGALIIVVAAVVISKRRSISIASGDTEDAGGAAAGPNVTTGADSVAADGANGGPAADEDGKTAAGKTAT
jgi:hypothetical protein